MRVHQIPNTRRERERDANRLGNEITEFWLQSATLDRASNAQTG